MPLRARKAANATIPIPELPQPRQRPNEAPIRATDRISLFIAQLKRLGGVRRRRRQSVVAARRPRKAAIEGHRGEYWSLAAREVRYLKRYYQLRYVRRILTDYRNAVRDAFGDHPVLDYLRPSAGDQEKIAEIYAKQVYRDHLQLQAIDPEVLLAAALRAISMAKDVYILAGLVLLTGRRPAELFFSGSFKRVKGNDYALLFSGQLKTRGSELAQTGPYEIPILAHADEVLAAVDRLRVGNVFSGAAQVNSLKGKAISDAVAWVYGRLLGEVTARELRKVYATIAYAALKKHDISLVAYTAKILGHATTDLNTALSYIAYYIEGTYTVTRREIQRSETEILADLLRLRDLQHDKASRRQVDDRIAQLGALLPARILEKTSPTPASQPALTNESARTREALRTLSPAQLRLLSKVSIGETAVNTTTQSGRVLRRLETAGIVTTKARPRSTIVDVALTPFGTSVASLATRA